MLAVFFKQDHGEQTRPGKTAWQNMKRRRCLADFLASPAGELLTHMLDDFPLLGNDLKRFGDVFTELRKFG
jgi:hypothetical protein